jgi:hypothetical protein
MLLSSILKNSVRKNSWLTYKKYLYVRLISDKFFNYYLFGPNLTYAINILLLQYKFVKTHDILIKSNSNSISSQIEFSK